jgi:16S rRNA (adenine1518-N6/adenine1519-N6)-dimethyltransferase
MSRPEVPETPGAVRRTLLERSIRPRKRWGQNFLADANLRDAVVADAGVRSGELVLEVGPGLGTLTKGLLARGAEVTAVELDPALVAFLVEAFAGEDRLTLVSGDVLQRGELAPAVEWVLAGRPFRVVSNLPYSSASPFLAALARRDPPPDRITVMVQREVAARMAAAPGNRDYGPLAVLLALRGDVRILREVTGRVFVPPAAVRSAVVQVLPRPVDREWFLGGGRLAREAFLHRRKTLRRALTAAGYATPLVAEALADLGLDPGARPEAVDPESFAGLAERLGAPRTAGG